MKTVALRAAVPDGASSGFIHPCELALVDRPPVGPGWLHEIKHDGFRILAWKQGELVKVWSRRGAGFPGSFLQDCQRSSRPQP